MAPKPRDYSALIGTVIRAEDGGRWRLLEVLPPQRPGGNRYFRVECTACPERTIRIKQDSHVMHLSTRQCGCGKAKAWSQIQVGQRFGRLEAAQPSWKTVGGRRRRAWECICDCGARPVFTPHELLSEKVISCSCHKSGVRAVVVGDTIGQREVTAIRQAPRKAGNPVAEVLLLCICGDKKWVTYEQAKLHPTCTCRRRKGFGEAALRQRKNGFESRARELGVPFKLTDEMFRDLAFAPCAYCTRAPHMAPARHYFGRPLLNSIDRVVNSAGYDWENCRSACDPCNKGKGTLTYAEWVGHAKKIVRHSSRARSLPVALLPREEKDVRTFYRMLRIIAGNRRKGGGIPFEVTLEEFDVLTSGDCQYCGAPARPIRLTGHGKRYIIANGLDRLSASSAYRWGSVVPCCTRCNGLKMEEDAEEFIARMRKVAKLSTRRVPAQPPTLPPVYLDEHRRPRTR